jgi:magnesium-transporting ATPase (P-type)
MERENRNRCHTFKVKLGPIQLNFNPVVTVVSAIIIWGAVAWCVGDPDGANHEMGKIKKWITATFTWFYIGAMNALIFFLIYLYFSKYSDLKLGKDDEKPEFSDGTYFTMLFAAGIGIGLFYFSVAEPISHYAPGEHGNRYWKRYLKPFKLFLLCNSFVVSLVLHFSNHLLILLMLLVPVRFGIFLFFLCS